MPPACGLIARMSVRGPASEGALALAWRGLVGRRRERGNVLWYVGIGEICERPSGSLSERSSSACSGIFGSIARPLQETGYDSSMAIRRGLLLRPELSGEAGRRWFV